MKQALRVAFGFLMLWAAVLHAEVRIEITQGVDSARPIGVVPFQWAGQGAAPEDVGGIVAADLRTKGYELSLSWRDEFQLLRRPFTYSVTVTFND